MLAWNLGDPGGEMQTVIQNGKSFPMHPMKGAMTTQTLRGLLNQQPYHWRGDRADFDAFNPAFSSLMGGPQLSSSDMSAFTAFINTLTFQPNPFQNLDRTPASMFSGDPVNGQIIFLNTIVDLQGHTCAACHTIPGSGTNNLILPNFFKQNMKTPELRNMYQKQLFSQVPGSTSIAGFGLDHNGEVDTLYKFLSVKQVFPGIANDTAARLDLVAFMLTFDTGTAPAVGYARTVTAANVAVADVLGDWGTLQNQAVLGNIDLIAKGTLNGQVHGLLYQTASNNWQTDKTGLGPFTSQQLAVLIRLGDTLTLTGVPGGSGVRMGIDRNLNGVLDADEPGALAARRSTHQ